MQPAERNRYRIANKKHHIEQASQRQKADELFARATEVRFVDTSLSKGQTMIIPPKINGGIHGPTETPK